MNAELKAAAEAYWEKGYVVIPWRYITNEKGELEKKPDILEWKSWQTRPQTKDELCSLQFDTADGIGLLCGAKNKDGYYLGALDYDVKPSGGVKPTDESLALGKKILGEMPDTQTEETQSRGIHLYYLSCEPVKTEKKFKKQTALEFLGAWNLVYVAPSKGYTIIHDVGFAVLDDLQSKFYETLSKHGLNKTQNEAKATTPLTRKHDSIEQVLQRDPKLSDLFKGDFQKYGFPSRSEAEQSVLVKLVMEGFTDREICEAMAYCQIGKWQEKTQSYKTTSLKNARETAKEYIDENKQEQNVFEPVVLAKEIMADYHFAIEEQSRFLFAYDPAEGQYSDKAEELIKREMAKRLDEETRARYYNDVFFYINATAPIKSLCEKPEFILVKNGILNTLTKELADFSHEFFLTSKIPVVFDAKADCPLIKKFFSEVLEEGKIKVLQELIGYALYREIIFHKAGLLVGKGRNGKGVTLKLVESLLGKKNYSSETVQDLCYNRFSKANLYLKLANISADLPSSELKHTGNIKMLIAGDTVNAEFKTKTAFPFVPFAKHFYSCNQIPPIANTEDNDAYYLRWVIIEYTKQFIGKQADKKLIKKLTTETEISGLLNWALDGLKRLIEQNDFSETEDAERTRKEYIKRSDSKRAFIEEMVTTTDCPEDFVFNDILHRTFIKYCHAENLPPSTKGELTKAMQQFCPGAERFKKRPSSEEQKQEKVSPVAAWRYIKLKEQKQAELKL